MRWVLKCVGLLVACITTGQLLAAPASKSEAFPLKVHEKQLANGLKVMVVPTGFPNLVSLQIPVQTGSRNEVEAGKTGFAHFFEHMMFRGTKNVPPDVYETALKKMGARQNAYTSGDYTNYHTTFAKDDLEEMLRLEADRFMNLSYGESEFKTEARAVLGEYNKGAANPSSKLWEVTKDAAFSVHPYKHTTMGFLKDIEDMPNQYAYSKTFFDRWYRPENTTIIIAGDVDPQQSFTLVEKYFKNWQHGQFQVKIPAEPAPKGPVYQHIAWENPTPPQLLIGFHGPAFAPRDRDYAALGLLFEMAVGKTSALHKRLVNDEQSVTSLSGSAADSKDPDLYAITAEIKEAKNVLGVRNAIFEALMQFTQQPVDAAELDRVRSNMRYSLGGYLDNTENIAALLAAFAHYERSASTLNQLYRTAETVTPADIQRVARKLFTDANLVVSTLAKDPLPDAVKQLPLLQSFVPQTRELKDVKLIVQRNSIPVLTIKLLFGVGSAQDPKGQEGVSALASEMISGAGSQRFRFEEIQQALYPYAASFSSQVDKEMTTFTIRVHKDQASRVLDTLLPSLLQPGLRDEDFQRLKAVQLNDLKNELRSNNEEELGKERLQELSWVGTSYAHPVLGEVAALEQLKLEQVGAFIRSFYTQKNLTVGINGQLDASIESQLKSALAQLPVGTARAVVAPLQPKPLQGLSVNIIEKNTRSTAISFGHPLAVTRSHPDFAALWLARAWLGEHRSSMAHLFQRIREVRGLNYGDYAYVEAFPGGMYSFFPPSNVARHNQLFEIWLRPVLPENAHMALRIALYELNKLVEQGLTHEEFESTREYLKKNVYVMTASQNQQIGYALDSDWYGMGDFSTVMRERLSKLTRDDVNAALKKYISSRNLQVVIVTQDANGLKDKLASDQPSTVKYDGEKPAELLAEDTMIGTMKLNIPASAIVVTPVDAVFAGASSESTKRAAAF